MGDIITYPGAENPPEGIESVKSSGAPVRNRIKSMAAAKALFDDERKAHEPDALRRARINGMINGNPPYDQSQLEELGLGYMINVNFQEARAILDAKAGMHYELFFEVPTLIEARQVRFSDPQQPAMDLGSIVAEEFTKACFAWSGFLPFMDKCRRESDAHGIGIGGWQDEWDWRPVAFNNGSFLTHKMAEMDIEKLPYAFLRKKMQIGELYEKALRNPEISEKSGWNLQAVRNLMKKLFIKQTNSDGQNDPYQTSTWESIEQKIRNGEFVPYEKQQYEYVKIVHLLVPEIDDGKVSHYIFEEDASELDGFLFEADRRYDRMSQAMWWLPYNNGDGYVHSVRGLASMIEHHCDLSNRFLGRVFDAGFTTSSILLQPKGPVDLSQLQLVRMGVITILPHNVNAVQTSFQPRVGDLVSLRDLSSNIMKNNTGIYRQHPELTAEMQAQKTAYQVAQEVAKEARAEKSNIAYDYDHVERLYREMFRRITNPKLVLSSIDMPGKASAKEFIAGCVSRGVPMELLLTPGVFEIYATRAIGMGSWGVKLDITNQVLGVKGMMDEAGQKNAVRDWLAPRVGYRNVDRYVPITNRDTIPSNERSIATLENNDIAEGKEIPVGSDQTHTVHFAAHAQLLVGLIQAYQESGGRGMKHAEVLMLLRALLPHMGAHLQYLSQDPTRADYVKQSMELLKQGEMFYKMLERVQKKLDDEAAKAAQDQQAMLSEAEKAVRNQELEGKIYEVQKKYELERMKQESLNTARAEKTAVQTEINRAKVQADLQLKQERQQAELDLERAKVAQKLELERSKKTE